MTVSGNSVFAGNFSKDSAAGLESTLSKMAGAAAMNGGATSKDLEKAIANARALYIKKLVEESGMEHGAAVAKANQVIAEAKQEGLELIKQFTTATVLPPAEAVAQASKSTEVASTSNKTSWFPTKWKDTLKGLAEKIGLVSETKTAVSLQCGKAVSDRSASLIGAVAIAGANGLRDADTFQANVMLNKPNAEQLAQAAKAACATIAARGDFQYLRDMKGKTTAEILHLPTPAGPQTAALVARK